MLRELKAAFDERVEEMAQSYVDVLELKARSGKHPVPRNVFLLIAFFPQTITYFYFTFDWDVWLAFIMFYHVIDFRLLLSEPLLSFTLRVTSLRLVYSNMF